MTGLTYPLETMKKSVALGRKAPDFPAFRPRRPWIGGDLQTLRNTFTYRAPDFSPYPSERLILPMNDGTGDQLWALVNRPAEDRGAPTVVLVHGLTGCETSRNIMTSAAYHLGRGHPVLRLNLRGAGPSMGKSREHYHAGRSGDLRAALAGLPADLKRRGLLLAGTSLGGNVVLKFMAENAGTDDVLAAASVCAPIDLRMAQLKISSRRNAVYQWHLLQGMKENARSMAGGRPSEIVATLSRIKSVYDFDDLIVAPNNGFAGADDYYRRSSAAGVLDSITTPTLLVHSRTDPWVPARMYLDRTWKEDGAATLLLAPDGGHVGFHAADDDVPWHNRCIGMFFDKHGKR